MNTYSKLSVKGILQAGGAFLACLCLLSTEASGGGKKESVEKKPDNPAARPSAAPKVTWTYSGKRRQATAEEINQWIKDLSAVSFKVREAAGKALTQVGQPAIRALQEAAHSGDLEMQQRAKMLIERIELNEAFAPTLIVGQWQDTPVPELITAIAKQTKIKLQLVPQQGPARDQLEQRRVKLDLNEVPLWEALDRLCENAGLTYLPLGQGTIQLQLAEGTPTLRPAIAHAGPFRFRITGMNYQRGLNLLGQSPPGQPGVPQPTPGASRTENLTVNLDLLAEPHVTVLNMGSLRILEAEDEYGQSLVTERVTTTAPYGTYYGGSTPLMQLRQTQFNLRPATKPAAHLRLLRGAVAIEVMAHRKPLITVGDIFTTKTKLFKGEGDLEMAILSVQDHGGGRNGNIRFFMTGVGNVQSPKYGGQNLFQQRFEVLDFEGRRLNAQVNVNYTGNTEAERTVEGNIYFTGTQDTGPATRLTFNSQKIFHATVPFGFRDVPMP